jgi:hypothetical protein
LSQPSAAIPHLILGSDLGIAIQLAILYKELQCLRILVLKASWNQPSENTKESLCISTFSLQLKDKEMSSFFSDKKCLPTSPGRYA